MEKAQHWVPSHEGYVIRMSGNREDDELTLTHKGHRPADYFAKSYTLWGYSPSVQHPEPIFCYEKVIVFKTLPKAIARLKKLQEQSPVYKDAYIADNIVHKLKPVDYDNNDSSTPKDHRS